MYVCIITRALKKDIKKILSKFRGTFMKTTAYLLDLHSFETRLRNHGSFPNITPCVPLVSTVVGAMSSMTLVARFNLAPDLNNRGEEKKNE